MERRPFGPTGEQVAVIGQGTWKLRNPRRSADALRAGIALGMTHLDTAELYRGAEEVIREAIAEEARARDATLGEVRDGLFLVSKVLPQNASHAGTLRACEASLRKLGTDRLDAYLLHWWGGEHPIEETMRAFGELLDRGATRFVGVSNLDVGELEAAQAALGGRHRIVCNQIQYHLQRREPEEAVIPYCRQKGIAVVAYSPFGGAYAAFPRPGSPGHRALEAVGQRHSKTPRQVALRWVTREPHVFTIPKAEDAAHVRENAGGQGWQLAAEDLADLDAAFPPGAQRGLLRFG